MARAIARPAIFGEVLFDTFEDGSEVLGGAPFNVAWHLHGFGMAPLFISRIGRDPAAEQVLSLMQEWGMDTSAVQRDERKPTGKVQISFHQGHHEFNILADQAYDYIDIALLNELIPADEIALLYHGTLALRNADSRNAFFRFTEQHALPVFTDINLRAPWWEKGVVDSAMRQARWAKINDDELCEITGGKASSDAELISMALRLYRASDLERLILTLGARGACIFEGEEYVQGKPREIENLQDTVGAGDAFSAVCITGILQGWPNELVLQRALEFAARICQVHGATLMDRDLYAGYRQEWQL